MSATVAKGFDEKRTALDVKELSLGWMIAYLFLISFLGLFSVLPLRKVYIYTFAGSGRLRHERHDAFKPNFNMFASL